MAHQILVFYGSYRSDRMGIRLADFIVARLRARGDAAELIDAKDVNLPMLDRMYKEYPPGSAPPAMEALASKIRAADAFVFIVGEYNWGVQPGLKNLTDHFLEEWFWRPAAIASYSGAPPMVQNEIAKAREELRIAIADHETKRQAHDRARPSGVALSVMGTERP